MANLANMSPQALSAWDRLKASWGGPLSLNSAYRDPQTNARVGGAKKSQHMHGNAFDVSTAGMTPEDRARLIQTAQASGFTGYGGYNNSLHFDVGPSRTWGPDYSSASTPEWLLAALDGSQAVADDTMTTLGLKPQGILTPKNTESKPMIAEQPQARGLLDSLGIQKRDVSAGGETALPFYQRDTFKDTAATLAQGFAAMGSMPALQEMTADISSQRTEQKARNKTVEYLRANGRDDLADMVEKGLIGGKEAAVLSLQKPDVTKGVAVGDRIVNPVTGEVIYEGAPTLDKDAISNARKEFTALPMVKAFATQTTAYGRVISSAEDPSPAGDLALIFNYMKVLDPGSTVREGEFATAQASGNIDDRTRSLYNQIVSGQRLSERQRADFADRATRLYSGAEQQYKDLSEQYAGFARAAGLPFEQVIPNFGFSGERYKRPLKFSPPPAPTGVSPEDWVDAWSSMTDEERGKFIEGQP